MQAQNKRKLMLSVLAFLLVARFAVLPVFDWQQQQIAQIESQSKKLMKVRRVIARLPQTRQALDKLQQSNQALQALYANQTSLQAFKLQQQQQIESLFESHNIDVKNFNWVAEIPGEISEVRAKITFAGKSKDLALLQLAIARLPTLLNVGEWTLHINRMDRHSLGKATGSLMLIAYNIPVQQEPAL